MEHQSMEMRMDELAVSSRNRYLGTVTAVREGPVSAEIELDLNGSDTLTATVWLPNRPPVPCSRPRG